MLSWFYFRFVFCLPRAKMVGLFWSTTKNISFTERQIAKYLFDSKASPPFFTRSRLSVSSIEQNESFQVRWKGFQLHLWRHWLCKQPGAEIVRTTMLIWTLSTVWVSTAQWENNNYNFTIQRKIWFLFWVWFLLNYEAEIFVTGSKFTIRLTVSPWTLTIKIVDLHKYTAKLRPYSNSLHFVLPLVL